MAEEQQQKQQRAEAAAEQTPAVAEGRQQKGRLDSTYYSVISRTSADGRVMIGEDAEVFPGEECPEYASPGTRAYTVKDRRSSAEQFALLCNPETVPRVTMIGTYKGLKNQNVMRLINAGIVNWPAESRQKFALMFEKPAGKKVLASAEEKPQHVSEEGLVRSVIEPVIRLLAEFRDIDFIHGAINLQNIYMAGTDGLERLIIGECLSSAPSWGQHPIYETPARAMAQPAGRGPGTARDDLYAFGICVAMMARSENLMAGKAPQQIIHDKIEHGSFGAVIGRERIPGGIVEFLRGVLNDDSEQRWDINDALRWLEGRRASPKQSRVILKAARPLVFCDQKYWDLRSVTQAFSEHITEAAAEIEKGQFDVWLKRNFEDKPLEARFEGMWLKEKDAPRERLVSSVCMALDPYGPIRYKGLSLFPGGLGMALAHAMAWNEDIQVYGDLIAQQLMNSWVSQSFEEITDAAGILGALEKCRSALTQKMPGYGIERVVYMLDMEVACLSPLLRSYFVLSPGGLLLALENISQRGDRPEMPLDRHMIAFISVRESKMIDPHIGFVNSKERGSQVIGAVRTLAAIQRRFAVGPVPGVCNWLISMTGPVVDMLHDQELRQELTQRISALKDRGNLTALLDLIDDSSVTRDDNQRFAMARQYYKSLLLEKEQIEMHLRRRRYFGRGTGRQIAMLVSSVLSTVIIAGYVILRLMKLL